MNEAPDAPIIPETAVTELSLAIGQLVRRLRMEANPGELTWSQIATLARLDKAGWMTTADLARAELVKPQSMGTTLADLEQAGLVQRRPHPTDGVNVAHADRHRAVEDTGRSSSAPWSVSVESQHRDRHHH